jgi:hypothetical protein
MYRVLVLLICLGFAGAINGCYVFMLPGMHWLLPANYYFAFEIDVHGTRTTDVPAPMTDSIDGNPYVDDDLEFRWWLSNIFINLDIHNKTSQPLRIHWAEGVIALESLPEPLVASISYLRKGITHTLDWPELPQDPSEVAPFMKAKFCVFPYSHSRWQPFTGSLKGFWTSERVLWDLEPGENQTKQEMQALADKAIGRTIRISLPIEVNGVKKVFVFDLQVTRAIVRRITW